MTFAYVDSSYPVAVALSEPGHRELRGRLNRYDRLFAANLLEAELLSALAREEVEQSPASQLGRIEWVHPARALTGELEKALLKGLLRGADLWHVACALYLQEAVSAPLDFLTLDARQRRVVSALGFEAP